MRVSALILSIGVIDTVMSVAWFLAAIIYMLTYTHRSQWAKQRCIEKPLLIHFFVLFFKSLALFHFPLLTLLLKRERCAFGFDECVCFCVYVLVDLFVCVSVCMHECAYACSYAFTSACVHTVWFKLYCAWRVCESLLQNVYTICTQMQRILYMLLA